MHREALPAILMVVSGKGGVGKSTVAANLATGLAAGGVACGLLDADFHGPSIPTMFGLSSRPLVADGRMVPERIHGVSVMSAGLLADFRKAFVWRGALLRGVLWQMLHDTDWSETEALIVDLPPGTGEVAMALLDEVPASAAVIVTTPQDVAAADVDRALTMLAALSIDTICLVENMAVATCPNCEQTYAPFHGTAGADLASRHRFATTVRLPMEIDVSRSGDLGRPAVLDEPDGRFAKAFRPVVAVARTHLRAALTG